MKAKGRYRQQGKDYVVGDGDIILFKVCAACDVVCCDLRARNGVA